MSVHTMEPEVEVLATGLASVEGPTVHPDGHVYFTNPNGGGVHRLTPGGTVELVVPKRKGVGGVAAHADGGIVISGRDLTRVVDGTSTVLVAREDIPAPDGLRAIGFNDIVADAWGNVLAGCHLGDVADGRHVHSCLVYVAPGEAPLIAYDDVAFTNGIAHDAEARWLFHSDTGTNQVLVSAMAAGGPPVRRRAFSTTVRDGHPDGMAVDADGLVWVAMAGGGGVARFRPDGTLDTWLALPAPKVLSVCFLGPDVEGMYVTTMDDGLADTPDGGLWRVDVPYVGAPVGLARI